VPYRGATQGSSRPAVQGARLIIGVEHFHDCPVAAQRRYPRVLATCYTKRAACYCVMQFMLVLRRPCCALLVCLCVCAPKGPHKLRDEQHRSQVLLCLLVTYRMVATHTCTRTRMRCCTAHCMIAHAHSACCSTSSACQQMKRAQSLSNPCGATSTLCR
jgi:hypothetical protein